VIKPTPEPVATGLVQSQKVKQREFSLLLKKSDVRGLKSDVWIAHYFIDKYQNCVIN
jgi:hypothetical protein